MTTNGPEAVRTAVREAYGARARAVAAGAAGGEARGYGEVAASLPATVVSYGCGNPTAIAGLRAGEVVLDLGSGAGLDCFLAARQVGSSGHVYGLDMTDDMLALAEANRVTLQAENVEFRRGEIEAIPLPDASVDVIISNCVVNLSPDKDVVFRESLRVLRPGGRVHIADMVLTREISAEERADLDLWAGCRSGALLQSDYAQRLRAAGFADVAIQLAAEDVEGEGTRLAWQAALISARRPGGADAGVAWPRPGNVTIEFLAPAGLATAACCATDAGPEGVCCMPGAVPTGARCC